MNRIIAWCVGSLPFNARSRRAIDETLADWTHELQQSPTRARRALAGLEGLLSILRVVSTALVREAADLSWTQGLGLRFAVVAALVTLAAFATSLRMVHGPGVELFALGLLGVPLMLLVVLPPAIFLVFAWRPVDRSAPVAGSAFFLALATLALAGWLVPMSTRQMSSFLYHSVEALTPETDMATHLSRGQAALAVTGWAGLAGASAICAAIVARRSPLRSHWWLAAVPAIYLALIPLFTFAIGTSFIVLRSVGDPPEGFRPGVAAWTTTSLAMTAAMIFGRRARQPERSV